MIVISGTNRKDSRSGQIAKSIVSRFEAQGTKTELCDLADLNLSELSPETYGEGNTPPSIQKWIDEINVSEGLYIVCPEYNGSFPGALKFFIDHWDYPKTFQSRPVSFMGIGGRFGGLRPVEHLQQIFGYRNAFIFPERVFVSNVWTSWNGTKFTDDAINGLLDSQIKNYITYVEALKNCGLHPLTKKES